LGKGWCGESALAIRSEQRGESGSRPSGPGRSGRTLRKIDYPQGGKGPGFKSLEAKKVKKNLLVLSVEGIVSREKTKAEKIMVWGGLAPKGTHSLVAAKTRGQGPDFCKEGGHSGAKTWTAGEWK